MNRKVVIGGVPDDETSLLIKDGEGTIIKGIPIRTASPHKMEIKAHPYPESRQLIVGQEYNITTTIFDKEGHEIFPSENILMKTTFGKQLTFWTSLSMVYWQKLFRSLLELPRSEQV